VVLTVPFQRPIEAAKQRSRGPVSFDLFMFGTKLTEPDDVRPCVCVTGSWANTHTPLFEKKKKLKLKYNKIIIKKMFICVHV
jgi:hypothetical protein